MIQTETQLEASQRWATKFREELEKLPEVSQKGGNTPSVKLIREALSSLAEDIEKEISEYLTKKKSYKAYLQELRYIEDSLLSERVKSSFPDHPNKLLANWRSITEEQFAQSKFFGYSPNYIGYGYFTKDSEGNPLEKSISCHYYLYRDGTGFGIENDYWGKKVNYYAFGCEHQYRELNGEEAQAEGYQTGHCIHVYKCQKCGYISVQDSSD